MKIYRIRRAKTNIIAKTIDKVIHITCITLILIVIDIAVLVTIISMFNGHTL